MAFTSRSQQILLRYIFLTTFPNQLVGNPAKDPPPKPIPWKQHHKDLKKPLQGYVRRPRNILCTISNIR
ncbi:hypothetical protein KIN20_017472 [Parelaphostrongylus tenuis]|uniref:Uncharacterized protein n=1 Tax=Parelaphostrongylus tenuis TaxID=148309 RepID=A0AAD5MHZ8_PARTN|nr:hypothetical protein KIN20_017472 [Parelaphostrongylus tenuis]